MFSNAENSENLANFYIVKKILFQVYKSILSSRITALSEMIFVRLKIVKKENERGYQCRGVGLGCQLNKEKTERQIVRRTNALIIPFRRSS